MERAVQVEGAGLEPWNDCGTVRIGDITVRQRELRLRVGTLAEGP